MKRNKTRHVIYLRTFSALFATYLVLMTAFTFFQLAHERKAFELELSVSIGSTGRQIDQFLNEHINHDDQRLDLAGFQQTMITQTGLLGKKPAQEIAVYNGNYELLFQTNDNWLVTYSETIPKEGIPTNILYAELNPGDWFNPQQIRELEDYLRARPKAEKAGDLSGYILTLRGFWLDGFQAIPDQLDVIPMIADSFKEDGEVDGSHSDSEKDTITYTTGYVNTRGLPYIQDGGIWMNKEKNTNLEQQSALRRMVLDKDRLISAIKEDYDPDKWVASTQKKRYAIPAERVRGLVYRYYLPFPYQSTVQTTDGIISSNYWTVVSREEDLWGRSTGPSIS